MTSTTALPTAVAGYFALIDGADKRGVVDLRNIFALDAAGQITSLLITV